MVKKFRRAAAGVEEQLPSDLRPPAVLRQTCDYLFHDVLGSAKLSQVHHFVWDRTRAIRNDLSIQQLSKGDDLSIAIECCERIARFHILSLHQLALEERPYEAYDSKQEREQLDKTLLSLMQYYDDCRGRIPLPNEAEFRAYCVLFQLQDRTPDLEDRVQSWPRDIAKDQRVQQALKVYAAACNTSDVQGPFFGANATAHIVARQDWENFWQLVKSRKVSYLMACVAEIYFNLVRKMVLSGILRTTRFPTKGPTTEWTLSDLGKLFYFDDDEQLEDFCGRFGLQFRDLPDGSGRYLEINGKTLPQEDAGGPSQLKTYLVESKRERRTLSAVIDGLSVRQAQEQGMLTTEEEEEDGFEEAMEDAEDGEGVNGVVADEDDEDSLFVPEAKPEKDKPAQPLGLFGATPTAAPVSFGEPLKTNPFGAAQPSSNPSAFGAPSSGPSTFGQPSGPKPFTGFGQPTQAPNPFAPAAAKSEAPASQANSNPFKSATGSSLFSNPPAPTTSLGLGISSTPSTAGDNAAPKLSFGGFGQPAENKAPSTFPPKPADNASVSPGTSLFAPKPAAVDAPEESGSTTPPAPVPTLSNPFATSAPPPKLTFPPLALPEQQNVPSLEFKAPAAPALGSPFGATPASPSSIVQSSPIVQPETNFKPISPQSPPPQPHPTSPNTTSQPSNTTQQAGASSPPRRLSGLDTKPKRPSPLSNSFTASDDATADKAPAQPSTASLKPPQPQSLLFPQQQPQASPAAASPASTAASEFDAILTRLANELVTDPTTGYLKQFVEFSVRSLVTEVQEKVYLERITQEADDFRQFSLEDKYGKRWRSIIKRRRDQRKLLERRKRQERRLQESQDQDMGNSGSVMDTSSLRSSRAGSAIVRRKPNKHAEVDAMFQSTNGGSRFSLDRQARAGSKRTADTVDDESVVSLRENGHKRAKSTSHVDRNGRVVKPTASPSPQADILQRSSFLGFSLAGDASKRTSTTKSTYFRMKAMGLKPKPTESVGTDRGTKRSRSESLDAATAKLDASSLARLNSSQDQDRALMPPPSARSVRSKPDTDDETLFARLRAAREALQEGANFLKSEVVKEDEFRRSRSGSRSDHESPTMERARAEARLRLSGNSDFGGSVNNREVPAYRLRESRFVPREQYGKAIERANELRASRSIAQSIASSRPTSRTEQHVPPTPTKAASPSPKKDATARPFVSQKRLPQLPHTNGDSESLEETHPATTAAPDPVQTFPSGDSLGFGFSSHAASLSTQPQDPFSQSTSFAGAFDNSSNPFLQDAQQVNSHDYQSNSNAIDSYAQPTNLTSFASQTQANGTSHGSSNAFAQNQNWSFATAPEQPEQTQDHTISVDQIPDALSASFGHPAATLPDAFASQESEATPANSYMPSQTAAAAISLLSDDEDETPRQVAESDQNTAFGQAQFFNQLANAADDGKSLFGDEEAEEETQDQPPASQPEYINRFAALADEHDSEDNEEQYEDEEDEREEDFPGQNQMTTPNESELEYDDDDEEDEQEPGSYQHGPVLTEAELADDDENEDLEEDEELELDEAGNILSKRFAREYSEEDEDGDVEDEDGYDEEGEEYDEETDEDPGMYANSYQANYGRQVYAAPPPKSQAAEALQKVGQDENEPICLSD